MTVKLIILKGEYNLRKLYPYQTKGAVKSEGDAFLLQEFQRYTTRSVKKALILNVLLLVLVIFLEFRSKKQLQQLSEWSFLEGAINVTINKFNCFPFFSENNEKLPALPFSLSIFFKSYHSTR